MSVYTESDRLHARALGVELIPHCKMCAAHEVREAQQRIEIAESAELADELAADLSAAKREADLYRQKFYLALACLAGVFVMVMAGWVR